MRELDRSIFRKYDIRGTANGASPQLTPGVSFLVGRALGTYLPREFSTQRVFVGSDNRLSSGPLKTALIEGLAATGLPVTDIGEVLTPTVYFASASYGNSGAGVMITGSHLDTRYNGIKMAYGKLALAGEQIQELLRIIDDSAFAAGDSEISEDPTMINKHMTEIQRKVFMAKPMKVVMDAGNGLSGTYLPPVLRALGLDVECLYCEPDGAFPNHLPNPEWHHGGVHSAARGVAGAPGPGNRRPVDRSTAGPLPGSLHHRPMLRRRCRWGVRVARLQEGDLHGGSQP